jgi:hypothetical protein
MGRAREAPISVPRPITCVDTSEILEGRVDAVKEAIATMAAFVEANEPNVILYEVFLDESQTLMTVVQIHPDAASMELHLDAARPVFAPFLGLVRLATIDVYGDPSRRLLEQLHEKAAMLGNARIAVHGLAGGIARLVAG